MAKKPKRVRSSRFRVFSDNEGNVFLAPEAGGETVGVERPVTSDRLAEAKKQVIETKNEAVSVEHSVKKKATSARRAKANQEIEVALNPIRKGHWFNRLRHAVYYFVIRGSTILFSLILIAAAYKGVQYSSELLPEPLHVVVLFLYLVGLVFLIFLIGTEENRIKYRKQIMFWFGPRGMLVLPILLLGTAGSVLASITFRLQNRGLITLDMCSGRPMSEAGLLDFYMWHFVNIIPTLQITRLWRWGEPYCYKQSRIGFLIFAFQLFVVIPSFNTIRFYWKHRKTPSEYIYDPHWNPEPE